MDDGKSSGAAVQSRPNGRASQAVAETRSQLPCRGSWNVSGTDTHAVQPNQSLGCCICDRSNCTKISHRLAQLEMRRRASRASKPNRTLNRTNVTKVRNLSATQVPVVVHHMPKATGQLDPFVLLPLKGITKPAMDQFHQYFTCQASSVFDPDRPLSYDVGLLPLRFRQSVESAAMCASVITMAATLNALRYRKLTTPDADLLASYKVSLRALRNEIEGLNDAIFSENTVLAAISIATSCGIAFSDPQIALSHWQGVLALFNRQTPAMWNGPVIAWVDNLEWWLTVLAGLQPRCRPWPVPIAQGSTIPVETYGSGFRPLFDYAMRVDDLTSKLLAVCLNTCRAIEMLERLAKRLQRTPDTYFDYFRLILMHQCTIVSGIVNGCNTLAECITITVNICYMMLLRVLPYGLPLQHLCARLQATMESCGQFNFKDSLAVTCFVEEEDEGGDTRTAGKNQEAIDAHANMPDNLLQDVYIWMLGVCLCAARQSGDRSCQDWVISALCKRYCSSDVQNSTDMRRADVLRRSRLFCWSDDFLSKHLLEIDVQVTRA